MEVYSISKLLEYVLMGFALSADAGSVSLVYGTRFSPFKYRYAVIPAISFGIAQGLMPVIGWLGGEGLAGFLEAVDHWVAFAILVVVGGKFIYDSRQEEEIDVKDVLKPWPILLAAFATSIDACAVGFGLSMAHEAIIVPAIFFTTVTFLCSLICCRIGASLGEKYGPKLLLVGGIVLILIGFKILLGDLYPGIFDVT